MVFHTFLGFVRSRVRIVNGLQDSLRSYVKLMVRQTWHHFSVCSLQWGCINGPFYIRKRSRLSYPEICGLVRRLLVINFGEKRNALFESSAGRSAYKTFVQVSDREICALRSNIINCYIHDKVPQKTSHLLLWAKKCQYSWPHYYGYTVF